MSVLYLVKPSLEHKQAALELKQEFINSGEQHNIHGSGGFNKHENYEVWLDNINNAYKNNPNKVPGNIYFGFCDDKIVGMIAVRYRLNENLLKIGGHIGYSVRPSERCKGYASAMVALALEECKKLNIGKVLITCDKDNIASAQTIIKSGGILENEFMEDNGNIVQRYWIDLMQGSSICK